MPPRRPQKAGVPFTRLRKLLNGEELGSIFSGRKDLTDEEALAELENFLRLVKEKKAEEARKKEEDDEQKKKDEEDAKASAGEALREVFGSSSSSSSDSTIIYPEGQPDEESDDEGEGGAFMTPIKSFEN